MIVNVILLLLILLIIGYYYLHNCYQHWKKKKVPFPKTDLFFGNVKSVLTGQKAMGQICREIYNEYIDNAYVGFYNFQTPAIIVRDVELVSDILVKNFHKFADNWSDVDPIFDPLFSNNPFILKGDRWKPMRSQLTTQFTSVKLKTMFPFIKTTCKNIEKYLEMQTDLQDINRIDTKELSEKFTSDNVASCIFGIEGNAFTDSPNFWKMSKKLMEVDETTKLKQTLQLFCPLLRRLLMLKFFADDAFRDFIKSNIEYRKQNNITSNDYFNYIHELKHKTTSFKYTDDHMAAHALTFLLDGYGTSSDVLSFALYELAINPHVQRELQEELDSVLKKYNGSFTYESLQEMRYLEKIVLETTRKHPAIPFLGRRCTENYEVPPSSRRHSDPNVIIEKGTHVFIPTIGIHFDPQYYPDPDKFDPSRFDNDVKNLRPKCTFLGFGEGPRICLGKQFAILQIKAGLATIVANYEIRLNEKTTVPPETDFQAFFYFAKTRTWVDLHKRTDKSCQAMHI